MDNTGIRLASYITDTMREAPFIPSHVPYKEIEEYVYKVIQQLANNQVTGDWLETPTGCTYTLTFKPTRGE